MAYILALVAQRERFVSDGSAIHLYPHNNEKALPPSAVFQYVASFFDKLDA